MPIKPENKNRYPSNWKQIREQVLERAGHKCEFCGLPNHTLVERPCNDRHGGYGTKMVKVVLTIAHMDNIPEHCELDNLRALCQRCHLRYDAKFHADNARLTRMKKEGQLNLFE